MKFYCIARVNGTEYLTKVEASSALSAEHMILDEGINYRSEYGCDACQAFTVEEMAYDHFRGAAMDADPVSFSELMDKIAQNNARLLKKQEAEETLRVQQKALEALAEQMKQAQEAINAARAILEA